MLYVSQDNLQLVRDNFTNLAGKGEQLRCNRCQAVVEVGKQTLLAKYLKLLEHLKDCANGQR